MRLTERLAQQTRELARTRRLEQTVSALSVALRQTGGDVERALDSRAWRLGHSHHAHPLADRAAPGAHRGRARRGPGSDRAGSSRPRTSICSPGAPDRRGRRASAPAPTRAPLVPDPAAAALRDPGAGARAAPRHACRGAPPATRAAPAARALAVGEHHRADPRRAPGPRTAVRRPDRLHQLSGARGGRGRQRLERRHPPYLEEAADTLSGARPGHRGEPLLRAGQRTWRGAGGRRAVAVLEQRHRAIRGGLAEGARVRPSERWRGGGGGDAACTGRIPPGPQGEPRVQHRAIRFRWQEGTVKAFNEGDGEACGRARSARSRGRRR